MTTVKLKLFICTVVLIMISTGLSLADISWEQVDTNDESGEITTFRQKIFFSGKKFAIESSDDIRMIIDLNDNTITTIDMKEKIYFTTYLENMEQLQQNIKKETEKIIEEALKNIPEDQRVLYRQRLEQQMGNINNSDKKPESNEPLRENFIPTGKTETILGYKAVQYRSKSGDGTLFETWCATDIDVSELINFFNSVSKGRLSDEIGQGLSMLNFGFPLKSWDAVGDTVHASEVISISFDPIPASFFTIPDTYTESVAPFSGEE